MNGKITSQIADWFTVTYSTKWTREDFDRPSYLTGLFFHNIARRWPTNPAYDPNGHPVDGMEIEQLENGGKQINQKDLNTQQLQSFSNPSKTGESMWKVVYAQRTQTNIGMYCRYMHTTQITNRT